MNTNPVWDMEEDTWQDAARSSTISILFHLLHTNGITYCHWKSNEHLDAALDGSTDLDMLFDEKQQAFIDVLLEESGFKKFVATPEKRYAHIHDWLGIDAVTGKLFHLHLHYRLSLGENYIKSYRIGLEERMLATRVYDLKYKVYRADPSLELVLLFIRYALKVRNRDKIKLNAGKQLSVAPSAMKEYRWLCNHCNYSDLHAITDSLFPGKTEVMDIITGGFSMQALVSLSAIVKQQFSADRNLQGAAAIFTRWQREISLKWKRKLVKHFSFTVVHKRVNPAGGLSVALIGADGSGKSTIIKSLETTFRAKLDVCSIYFGKGKGKMAWYRKMFNKVKQTLLPAKKQLNKSAEKTEAISTAKHIKQDSAVKTLFNTVEALLVAIEKKFNHQRMQHAKAKGMLVICDRYPQIQFNGVNDGPSLHQYTRSRNILLKLFAKWEQKIYREIYNEPPDMIVKLIADVEVIAARKPGETSIEMLEEKLKVIRALRFPGACEVVEIDAAQPLHYVLTTVREQVWNAIPEG